MVILALNFMKPGVESQVSKSIISLERDGFLGGAGHLIIRESAHTHNRRQRKSCFSEGWITLSAELNHLCLTGSETEKREERMQKRNKGER